jgi:Protein of unknown function (DUF1552)
VKPLSYNSVSRRFILRGIGASLALPFLPSLLPKEARAAGPGPCFVAFRQANGVSKQWDSAPERFWPRANGPLALGTTDADRAVNELKDYQSKVLILRNMDQANPTAHSCAAILTGFGIGQFPTCYARGESIDNRMARELHPGVEPLTFLCSTLAHASHGELSWRGNNSIRAAERDPSRAYARMVGATGVDAATQAKLVASRKSVNDLVREQVGALKNTPQLSAADGMRLQQHLDAVRDLERTLTCAVDASKQMELSRVPGVLNDPASLEFVAKLQIDVIALALSCGYTRVATLQMGGKNSNNRYNYNGTLLPAHHGLSHGNIAVGSEGDGAVNPNTFVQAMGLLHQVDRVHGRLFKYLLDRLSAYGIMDTTTSLWCNDIPYGAHTPYNNTPYIIAGGNGYFKTGQCLDVKGATHNKLLNSLLNSVGLRNGGQLIDNFGDPSLPKGELTIAKA